MLHLERPNLLHKASYEMMKKEWADFEDLSATSPGTLFTGNSYEEFLEYVKNLETNPPGNFVPATLYFIMDDDKIIGGIDIRHNILSNYLFKMGGHIGYGIRPSARGKWYMTQALALGLEKAKDLVTDGKEVLVVCFDSNVASARVIEKNGGIFEKTIIDPNGLIRRRYWIKL